MITGKNYYYSKLYSKLYRVLTMSQAGNFSKHLIIRNTK